MQVVAVEPLLVLLQPLLLEAIEGCKLGRRKPRGAAGLKRAAKKKLGGEQGSEVHVERSPGGQLANVLVLILNESSAVERRWEISAPALPVSVASHAGLGGIESTGGECSILLAVE